MKCLAHISPGSGLVLQNRLGPALRKQGLVDRSGPPPTPRDAEPVAEFRAVDVPKGFCLSCYLDFSCMLEELPDAVNSVETEICLKTLRLQFVFPLPSDDRLQHFMGLEVSDEVGIFWLVTSVSLRVSKVSSCWLK